ncbi:ABC-type lipoprotein export system ATPase subunit [Pedobacter sp. CG_S7]
MAHWLLLGASGSGKSTLLNHLAGLLKPTEGKIMVNGQDLYRLSVREMDRFRGRNIGIVFQRPHLISSLNVMENLEVANTSAGITVNRERNLSLLEDLNLQSKCKNYPHQLSHGQLQRVIAKTLHKDN